ncbi:hypothetical protein [Gillisia sp. Hel_I_29]|uniref:hypothetical protein n=1 Tax=Gillisia sp. Hel_I_29 TaxID=1249975 RepID=UPI0005509C98|nr:hypothetical protein [Gillisia sp. Hel_I_29]
MKEFKKITQGFSIPEIRSALYYLSRYIKQAEKFEDYKKDLFEDGINSAPKQEIKDLTKNLIASVEKTADKKASKFTNDEFYFWMDNISEFEDSLDPKISESQIENAIRQINLFESPNISEPEK